MKIKLFLGYVLVFVLTTTSSACGAAVQATPSASATPLPNTETPIPATATLTATFTITPTATHTATPTPYFIGQERKARIKVGESANLPQWGWAAATEELVQEFIDALEITMKINGQTVSGDLKKYWGPFADYHSDDYGDGYVSTWIYPLTDNPVFQTPGIYHVEIHRRLSRKITDGFVDPNTQKPNWFPQGTKFSTEAIDIEVVQ